MVPEIIKSLKLDVPVLVITTAQLYLVELEGAHPVQSMLEVSDCENCH